MWITDDGGGGITGLSPRDLLNTIGAIAKGAGFKSLRDAWADTTTAHGRLMLTILGGLAEFERELILARTRKGALTQGRVQRAAPGYSSRAAVRAHSSNVKNLKRK
jgi:DNA invertase Pin-like site-specific DNA recombinase